MASATRQLHRTSPLRNLSARILSLPGNPMRVFCSTSPLRHLPNGDIPGRVSTRRYCSSTSPESPRDQFQSQIQGLLAAVSPSVVALLSYFSGSKSREIPHSARRGTGVFVDPTLILTSARLVGRVSTVYDSDRRSVLHNCFIARTIALTSGEKVLATIPVAVNFAGDVAVLEVVNPNEAEGNFPAPCAVANDIADDDTPLLGIVRHGNCTALTGTLPGYRRQIEKSARPKAPWPLDDELEWVDYGASENNNSVIVSLADVSGSPWFNFQKEVVGIASWAAETTDGRINSYAVPPVCIRSMIDYAKNTGPHNPVVMDRWINSHSIPDQDSDIVKVILI
ncbi:hypothetical protein C2S52_010352 [Perilla frutescens var. hirtella]|nr:hypothetical protein C2S52_010352 [Perilla frutescens var. hirtella]KAH6817205.1 hypothetical protein C2S51_000808 [Perilla frutescens var. frutescens]